MDKLSRFYTQSNGQPLSSGVVVVYLAGTTNVATIYSNSSGTSALGQPFNILSSGEVTFYAPNGLYDIVITQLNGVVTRTNNVAVFETSLSATYNTLSWLGSEQQWIRNNNSTSVALTIDHNYAGDDPLTQAIKTTVVQTVGSSLAVVRGLDVSTTSLGIADTVVGGYFTVAGNATQQLRGIDIITSGKETVQNATALNVRDVEAGKASNFAIKTGKGRVQFGDTVEFLGSIIGGGFDISNLVQSPNGSDVIGIKRATDVAPTGNFIVLKTAGSSVLWSIDVNGSMTAGDVPAGRLSGTIASARLGSGAASTSTFLRGDSTWSVINPYSAGGTTINVIPKSDGSSLLVNSLLTEDGTTLTYTGTGGIVTAALISSSANVATAGDFRLPSTGTIKWRNNANGADLALKKQGATSGAFTADLIDFTEFGGIIINQSLGGVAIKAASQTMVFVANTAAAMALQANNLRIGVSGSIGFSSAADPSGTANDTLMSRAAAANFQLGGANAAAPIAQTLSTQGSRAGYRY
jgi:hypothetical protein